MTYASEVAADSPALWWRLGESSGTTATDASGNGRHGTYVGSPTLGATGLIDDANTAVTFDGVDDRVAYAATVLASSNALTVELWFKTSTPASLRWLMDATGAGGAVELSARMGATGQVTAVVNPTGAGSTSFTSIGTYGDNIRHHLAFTYADTADVLRVYMDGALLGSATLTGSSLLIDISAVALASTVAGSPLTSGTFDEFAIYGTALSAARILAHHTAANAPPITIHPAKITSTGAVHAPAIVPYVAPVDGNINIAAELTPATKYAACIQPDRSAQIEPARHVAGVNAT